MEFVHCHHRGLDLSLAFAARFTATLSGTDAYGNGLGTGRSIPELLDYSNAHLFTIVRLHVTSAAYPTPRQSCSCWLIDSWSIL